MKEQLNWRYGVKRYDSTKKVTPADLEKLRYVIRMAPSSFGLQPFKVLFIEDSDLRNKLSIASYHQPQVIDASCLVVFAVETKIDEDFVDKYFENICRTRGVSMEGSILKHRDSIVSSIERKQADEKLVWATHQAYLALGFMLLAAAELKIDANAMEGFIPSQYDEMLGLKEKGLHAVVIAAIGQRHPADFHQYQIKVRRPTEEIFIQL